MTRNPFGFVNKTHNEEYAGVHETKKSRGETSDDDFARSVISLLKTHNVSVAQNTYRVENYKALPDTLDDFKNLFIDDGNTVKNMGMFKQRIMGLTSYFRSAQESLMPKFTKSSNFHVVKIEMSQFQFGVYEEARATERKLELQNKEAASELAKKLKNEKITFPVKENSGKVFGSITSIAIYEKLSELGYEISRKNIDLKKPINTLGESEVKIKLYNNISTTIKVEVVPL